MTHIKNFVNGKGLGILLCFVIAIPSWFLGKLFPILGGPVIAIILGMIITMFLKNKQPLDSGVKFVSKKVLQWAVVLLGFGLNLNVVLETGKQSLPIIVCTITTSLLIAFLLHKVLKTSDNTAILVGVGSSICGGSAIAATAPVIDADDEDVAQSISVIFFFNVLAAIFFPMLGSALGFSTTSGEGFGIFAGTAINDTSSVTAAASTWDSMWGLGAATLDKAVTVKLTRTLAIIPITLVLAFIRAKKAKNFNCVEGNGEAIAENKVSFKQIFPFFILYFIGASIITTVLVHFGVPITAFTPIKELSKFFIVLAMAAIGINSNIVKLVKTGGKPLIMGACCWIGITGVSLLLQSVLGIW